MNRASRSSDLANDFIARDLLAFIAASPTPSHCVAESIARLTKAGALPLSSQERWQLKAGQAYYITRGGALFAFRLGQGAIQEHGFRLIGAHTDSPNLRLKPLANVAAHGYHQLGVEVYGGVLTHTWLDRDLGLAGSVMVRASASASAMSSNNGATSFVKHLVRLDRALLRVPSLAIHLDRDIHAKGIKLDKQKHLVPILGLGDEESSQNALQHLLSTALKVPKEAILSYDLSLYDLTPPTLGGLHDEFIFAPRLDNQAMCHAALSAFLGDDVKASVDIQSTQVICLYDHEEVGSDSTTGAGGSMVEDLLQRLISVDSAPANTPADYPSDRLARASALSYQLSADMAHAVHPNYADKHEPQHRPKMNLGPVLKLNTQQRYATCAEGEALFTALCEQSDIPYQKYVNRTDLPCGSTIGPISASRLGITTIDVGNPMLSMHSIREQSGSADVAPMIKLMSNFLLY